MRILLADLDSFDDLTPDQRAGPVNVAHQRAVLEELRRLREVLGLVCTASATTTVSWPKPVSFRPYTRDESDVVRLLDAGLTTEEIATILHISPETVEGHTGSIYRKLAAPLD